MSFIDNYRKQQIAGQEGWAKLPGVLSQYLQGIYAGGNPIFDPSPSYPPAANFAIEMLGYQNPFKTIRAAGNKLNETGLPQSLSDSLTQFKDTSMQELDWIKEMFLTPEELTAQKQAAAEQAKTGAAAPAKPVSPDARVRQAEALAARPAVVDLFSTGMPEVPMPPKAVPFQNPRLPQMAPMPMPPELATPNYSKFDEYMRSAMPQLTGPEGNKWDDVGIGLAQAAANWDPRTGWGGLLAGGFGGAAAGLRNFKQEKKDAEKAYRDEMRRWNATMADVEARRAGETADVKNKNAQNKFEYEAGATKQANLSLIEQHKIDAENMRMLHEANQENAKSLYAYELARIEREAPQIMDTNKEGVLWSEVKDGNRVVRYQSFGTAVSKDKDLEKIKKELGPDAYDLALFNRYSESKDSLGIMKQMATSAVDGGYAAEAFGADVYNQAVEAVMEDQTLGQPGSKEYAEKFSQAVANRLLRYVNLTDKEQLNRLAMNGNNFARYFMGAADGSY